MSRIVSSNSADRKKKNRNLLKLILDRRVLSCSPIKGTNTILRRLVECTQSRKFINVYEKSHKSPMVCHGTRLYLDSFAQCADLNSVSCSQTPRMMYSIDKSLTGTGVDGGATSHGKIEDMIECEYPFDEDTFCKIKGSFYAKRPYTIALTSKNYLEIHDFVTGERLEEWYLGSLAKFKYLGWEKELERIAVQSTHLSQNSTQLLADFVFVYIAIFKVTPLEFICILPISQRVFGRSITSVTVAHGLLTVRHHKNFELFSLENIIRNHTTPLKLGEKIKPTDGCWTHYNSHSNGIIGGPQFGIPVNVNLTEKPEVLFHVSINDWVSFGGYPWHYITNDEQTFSVRSVKNHIPAINGTFKYDEISSFGTTRAVFHSDCSGRIFYITPSYIR